MKDSPTTVHSTFPIGMVCSIGVSCLGNPVGSFGVVYEHYTLGEHYGVSIVFQNGNYDGFSVRCLEIMNVVPVRLSRALCNYDFHSVGKLSDDFQRGLFNHAFSANTI